MTVETYRRFHFRRNYPVMYPRDSPKPRIFGNPVRRGRLNWRHGIFDARRFNPMWGRDRWVNREWPDDWRPFRPGKPVWRVEDMLFRIRLRAMGRINP